MPVYVRHHIAETGEVDLDGHQRFLQYALHCNNHAHAVRLVCCTKVDHFVDMRVTADAGAVTLIQRFGSAANLNIHLHCLVLDGVYRRTEGEPDFQ